MELFSRILLACWSTLQMMSPFLLLGFLLSGVLSVVMPVPLVKKHLARPGKASVMKSALLGVPLPLCSCGVLPVATWIRRHGGSKGAVGAFLLATPQTGVDGFLVALGLLGLGFALFIPLAAFVSGVLLGLVLDGLFQDEILSEPLEQEEAVKRPVLVRIFRHAVVTIAGDIAVPLSIGILLAGVLSAFVDPMSLAELGDGFVAKLLVVAAAAPLYVCATASLPIGASMLMTGLSPGTVFVFLMAGPATNAATFTTISKLIGKREAITYLIAAVLLALTMGMLLDLLVPLWPDGLIQPTHCHDHHATLFHTISAVTLVGILLTGKIIRGKH